MWEKFGLENVKYCDYLNISVCEPTTQQVSSYLNELCVIVKWVKCEWKVVGARSVSWKSGEQETFQRVGLFDDSLSE